MSLSGEAVLYVSSPSDKMAQESARRERHRRKVYKELFETEKSYLQHLELVHKIKRTVAGSRPLRFDLTKIPEQYGIEVKNHFKILMAVQEEMTPDDMVAQARDILITTAKDMVPVKKKFFDFPLRFSCIVPGHVHNKLFSNLEQIRKVNLTLLEQMEQTTVGQAFTQLAPFLKLYSTYANNHKLALSTLQEWQSKSEDFAKFLSDQEDRPEVKGLKLNAFLIMPIQRIPRYKMLLEELLNNTPVEHHDYGKLQEAAEKIAEIASHINEYVRQNENFMKILAIQKSFDSSAPKLLTPGRQFIKEGLLKKVSRKGGKSYDRMFFLFSDILLYGKPKFLDGGGKSYTCSCILPLRHCKIEPLFLTGCSQSDTGGVFRLTCKEENIVLYSEDKSNARKWSEEIGRCIRKLCDDRQTLRKPSSNKIPLRGRSLRRHRQEQKKTDLKIPRKTPLRPLSLLSNDGSGSDSSVSVLARQEPVRRHFKMAEDLSLSHDAAEFLVFNSPVLRKRRYRDESTVEDNSDLSLSDCSVNQDISLRTSSSQSNASDVCRDNHERQSMIHYRNCVRGNGYHTTESCSNKQVMKERAIQSKSTDPANCSKSEMKSLQQHNRSKCSSAETSCVWFPPNSIAHKYQPNSGMTFSERLCSCLRNPLKRCFGHEIGNSCKCECFG